MTSFIEALLIAAFLVVVSPLLDGKYVADQGSAQALHGLHLPVAVEGQLKIAPEGDLLALEENGQLQTKGTELHGIGYKDLETSKPINDQLQSGTEGNENVVKGRFSTFETENLTDQLGNSTFGDQVQTQKLQNELGNGMTGNLSMVKGQPKSEDQVQTKKLQTDKLRNGMAGNLTLVQDRLPINAAGKLADLGRPKLRDHVQTQKIQNDKLGNGMAGNLTMVKDRLPINAAEELADLGRPTLGDHFQTQKTQNNKLGNGMAGNLTMVEDRLPINAAGEFADLGKPTLVNHFQTQRTQNNKLGNGVAGNLTLDQLPTNPEGLTKNQENLSQPEDVEDTASVLWTRAQAPEVPRTNSGPLKKTFSRLWSGGKKLLPASFNRSRSNNALGEQSATGNTSPRTRRSRSNGGSSSPGRRSPNLRTSRSNGGSESSGMSPTAFPTADSPDKLPLCYASDSEPIVILQP